MSSDKVSVIITCYNYAHFLPLAIDSALNQTHKNVEVVVVNDGSPDNTTEVMQRYISDPRVVYVNQANTGQAIATNNGIKAASGDFIAFLDADDIWFPKKLELQLPLFKDPEVGVVYCLTELMNEKGEFVERQATRKLREPQRGWILEALFLDNFVPFTGSVARRVCFDKSDLMDGALKMSTDWDLWLRIAVHYKFDYVNETLLRYRVGHVGQMTKNWEAHERDSMYVMNKFIKNHGALLPKKLVATAFAYSYCNRGYTQRAINGTKSLQNYLQALKADWCYGPAYLGLIKLAAYKVLQLFRLKP